MLEVKGRKSGEWRQTPVNPLAFEGGRYLVAPRGHTQWVRNMRVSGGGRLVRGRGVEEFTATELPDDEQPALLRAYLEKWKWEVGAFFDGVGPDSSDEELRRIAPDHPVFRITRLAAYGIAGTDGGGRRTAAEQWTFAQWAIVVARGAAAALGDWPA